jgi:peptidoglycan/xylan/chitin deacetylase (PgdA/CDA1 family)
MMIQAIHNDQGFTWPKGVRMAVNLSFDFQGGEHVKPAADALMDLEEYAIGEYGPNAGIWRIFRVLAEEGVKATFFTCGAIAERYPQATKTIIANGHEIAGHGYHHEVARKLKIDDERAIIDRATAMIENVSSKKPVGWRSCTQSTNTLGLLLDKGYLYNSNSFSHDLPFLWERGGRTLIELTRHVFGDGRCYGPFDIGSPDNALTVWREAFDELYEESIDSPQYLPFQLHPYISGRPGRAKALRKTIRHMKRRGVWFATCSEVAEWCRDNVFAKQLAKAS